eukprot:jgi/Mesvir1/17120/Mv07553-RA.1
MVSAATPLRQRPGSTPLKQRPAQLRKALNPLPQNGTALDKLHSGSCTNGTAHHGSNASGQENNPGVITWEMAYLELRAEHQKVTARLAQEWDWRIEAEAALEGALQATTMARERQLAADRVRAAAMTRLQQLGASLEGADPALSDQVSLVQGAWKHAQEQHKAEAQAAAEGVQQPSSLPSQSESHSSADGVLAIVTSSGSNNHGTLAAEATKPPAQAAPAPPLPGVPKGDRTIDIALGRGASNERFANLASRIDAVRAAADEARAETSVAWDTAKSLERQLHHSQAQVKALEAAAAGREAGILGGAAVRRSLAARVRELEAERDVAVRAAEVAGQALGAHKTSHLVLPEGANGYAGVNGHFHGHAAVVLAESRAAAESGGAIVPSLDTSVDLPADITLDDGLSSADVSTHSTPVGSYGDNRHLLAAAATAVEGEDHVGVAADSSQLACKRLNELLAVLKRMGEERGCAHEAVVEKELDDRVLSGSLIAINQLATDGVPATLTPTPLLGELMLGGDVRNSTESEPLISAQMEALQAALGRVVAEKACVQEALERTLADKGVAEGRLAELGVALESAHARVTSLEERLLEVMEARDAAMARAEELREMLAAAAEEREAAGKAAEEATVAHAAGLAALQGALQGALADRDEAVRKAEEAAAANADVREAGEAAVAAEKLEREALAGRVAALEGEVATAAVQRSQLAEERDKAAGRMEQASVYLAHTQGALRKVEGMLDRAVAKGKLLEGERDAALAKVAQLEEERRAEAERVKQLHLGVGKAGGVAKARKAVGGDSWRMFRDDDSF